MPIAGIWELAYGNEAVNGRKKVWLAVSYLPLNDTFEPKQSQKRKLIV